MAVTSGDSKIEVRLPADQHRRIKELAIAADRTITAEVRRAVRMYLEAIDREEV